MTRWEVLFTELYNYSGIFFHAEGRFCFLTSTPIMSESARAAGPPMDLTRGL